MEKQQGRRLCDTCGEPVSSDSASGATVCCCGARASRLALAGTPLSRALGIGIACLVLLLAILHR